MGLSVFQWNVHYVFAFTGFYLPTVISRQKIALPPRIDSCTLGAVSDECTKTNSS